AFGLLNVFGLPNGVKAADSPLFGRADVGLPGSPAMGGGLLQRFGIAPQQQLRKDTTAPIGRGPRPVWRDDTATAKLSNNRTATATAKSIGDRFITSFVQAGRNTLNGVRLTSSELYSMAANSLFLLNAAGDWAADKSGVDFLNIGENLGLGAAERWLR